MALAEAEQALATSRSTISAPRGEERIEAAGDARLAVADLGGQCGVARRVRRERMRQAAAHPGEWIGAGTRRLSVRTGRRPGPSRAGPRARAIRCRDRRRSCAGPRRRLRRAPARAWKALEQQRVALRGRVRAGDEGDLGAAGDQSDPGDVVAPARSPRRSATAARCRTRTRTIQCCSKRSRSAARRRGARRPRADVGSGARRSARKRRDLGNRRNVTRPSISSA